MTEAELVVIGGGAAGMMAAGVAANSGVSVVLLEPQRKLGRKLAITGKGRCNLTNNCDIEEFIENVPRNGRFLFPALTRFGTQETMEFFEALGVPLKTERGKRVFPRSDRASDLVAALEGFVRGAGARVVQARALGIVRAQSGEVRAVLTDSCEITCRAAAICTGGLSYPKTGSTGDGYRLARECGHSVTELLPSLVPLESDDEFCGQMQGFSLKNVYLSVYEGESRKPIFGELGELLFTHFGVSGPLVLSASAHMRNFKSKRYRLEIDLKPGLDEKKLDARLLRDFEKYKNRDFRNALTDLAGRAMIPVLIELSGIDPDTKVNSITREQRHGLAELFKRFPVSVRGTRVIDEAVVTSGGVSVREIDPSTMESKLVPGLYFAGEVLDIDAYTGGFNLQIAWSTAHLLGQAVSGGLK